MKRICAGVLAHVDAGKTTLSEALLYTGGAIRKMGRVDHGDAFLDTDAIERARGITVFAKQAVIRTPALELTLLDTPGHVDFSAETERTLQALDVAVLVVSGVDGVQAHTRTLWELLARYRVPTLLFVNKTDLPGLPRLRLMEQLRTALDGGCVDMDDPDLAEQLALCSEELMERYLEGAPLTDGDLSALIGQRKAFPCYFGSALKGEGVARLLDAMERLVPEPPRGAEFAALVYKIGRDVQGVRLSWLKITGGELPVKTTLPGPDGPEKVDQIRVYSGEKFTAVQKVVAGQVCAVTGLDHTRPGQGLGAQAPARAPLLEPVSSCELLLPDGVDPHTALGKLRQLEEEDPQLHLGWDERAGCIRLQAMGPVQQEILQGLIARRYGWQVDFGPARILYRETIAAPVAGAGHFEPLRHYAEVHLLLEPGPRGSGIQFASRCPTDQLEGSWQRLILSQLAETPLRGVLTGAPLTDVVITLAAGKAHLKHTEGGDFRQAARRAVRQGLMQAENLLLEPWYDFRLELPAGNLGRAMTDLERMGAEFAPPEQNGEQAVLTGSVPAAALQDYAAELAAYSRGQGRLSCTPCGYRPCRDPAPVIAAAGYDPGRDVDDPADSVFCSHGAGVVVPWREAAGRMHVQNPLAPRRPAPEPDPAAPARPKPKGEAPGEDAVLEALFTRTYGAGSWRTPPPPAAVSRPARPDADPVPAAAPGQEYLLVDGYNILFAWPDLKALAQADLGAARHALADILSNYQGFKGGTVILVYDAYKVPGAPGEVEKYQNIYLVYTKEAETADMFIEKATKQLARQRRVRVASSDGMEQTIILGHGALRVSAEMFRREVEDANAQITRIIEENRLRLR